MIAGHLSTEEIARHTDKVVLIPFGAFEQHGPWLPLLTDTIIAEEIARRVEENLHKEVLLFPAIWFGDSIEHRGFAGTVSVGAVNLINILMDMFSWLDQSGFKRGLLLNAHGGNVGLASTACEEFSRGHRFKIKSASVYPKRVTLESKKLFGLSETHGGSTEISLLYALRPDLRKTDASSLPNPHPYGGEGKLSLFETRELSANGVLHKGDTIEIDLQKGAQLVQLMVQEAATAVRALQSITQ